MQSTLKIALIAALPVEAVNLFLLSPPIDVGIGSDAPWYVLLIAKQWLILHMPGLLLMDWLGRIGLSGHFLFFLFVSGYLTTALLLMGAIFGFQRLLHLARKPSAEQN
jgi:hypothetical protein